MEIVFFVAEFPYSSITASLFSMGCLDTSLSVMVSSSTEMDFSFSSLSVRCMVRSVPPQAPPGPPTCACPTQAPLQPPSAIHSLASYRAYLPHTYHREKLTRQVTPQARGTLQFSYSRSNQDYNLNLTENNLIYQLHCRCVGKKFRNEICRALMIRKNCLVL